MKNKLCKTCKIKKLYIQFYKTKNAKDGYMAECKICNKIRRDAWGIVHKKHVAKLKKKWADTNRPKLRAADKKYRSENKDKVRNRYLLRCYGITLTEYNNMLVRQSKGCAICGRKNLGLGTKKSLAVDHDHKTGKVRGLLCGQCNYLIGLAKDDFYILSKASDYLKTNFEYENN